MLSPHSQLKRLKLSLSPNFFHLVAVPYTSAVLPLKNPKRPKSPDPSEWLKIWSIIIGIITAVINLIATLIKLLYIIVV